MKKYLPKIIVYLLVALAVGFWIASFVFKINAPKSKAAGETIDLSFSPVSVSNVAVGQDFTVKMLIKPSQDAFVRGYQVKINFEKTKLAFKSIQYLLGNVSSGLGDTTNQAATINSLGQIKVIGESQLAEGALLVSASKSDFVSLTFTVLNNSETNITVGDTTLYSINTDTSLFSGWAFTKENLTVNKMITPTPTKTPTPVVGNAILDMKLKFQGIGKRPADTLNKMTVRIKLFDENAEVQSKYKTADFTVDEANKDTGIWTGVVNFNVIPGRKYAVIVKGPLHLSKKICDATPTETAGGTYKCASGGKIALVTGANNLNFSGVLMLGGDLPVGEQDGSITAVDTSFIRNNLNTSDANIKPKCDINRDNRCDTQDYSLVIGALSIKNDEE